MTCVIRVNSLVTIIFYSIICYDDKVDQSRDNNITTVERKQEADGNTPSVMQISGTGGPGNVTNQSR